jgi:hypothetical protein
MVNNPRIKRFVALAGAGMDGALGSSPMKRVQPIDGSADSDRVRPTSTR